MNISGPIYTHLKHSTQKDGKTLAYGPEDLKCVEETLTELLKPIDLSKDKAVAENLGLLLGKIQSGKTKSFIGLMGLAFENGFDVAVVLTKNSGALADQTTKRLQKTFADFAGEIFVFDVMKIAKTIPPFVASKKLILVVKKEHNNIKKVIAKLTDADSRFKHKSVLIIDDEADNASAGYTGSDEEVEMAKVAKLINDLRSKVQKSFFLQVTATPYSLLMQNEGAAVRGKDELLSLKPKFVKLVPVHKNYIGGEYYFEKCADKGSPASCLYREVSREELGALKKPPHRKGFKVETDCLTSPKIAIFRSAIVAFVVGGCIRRLQQSQAKEKITPFAFLFHTQAGKGSHAWQDTLMSVLIKDLHVAEITEQFGSVETMFRQAYDDLSKSVKLSGGYLPSWAAVQGMVREALRDEWLNAVRVNSDEDVADKLNLDDGELRLDTPLTMFVGGQYLDRGVTISNLIGFFYGRNPDTFQQDTVLQHCRQFGFRPAPDCAVTRFYTTCNIRAALMRMHLTDTLLRSRIAEGRFDDCLYILEKEAGDGIRFCGFSKIKASNVNCIDEGSRILPKGFNTIGNNGDLARINGRIEATLAKVGITKGGKEDSGVVPLEVAQEIVELIASSLADYRDGYEDTWVVDEIKGLLKLLTTEVPAGRTPGRVGLLVRWDRERPYEEIPMDTPDNPRKDTDIARQEARNHPVLLLLHQKAGPSLKWKAGPFFWPVIFPPAGNRAYMYALSGVKKKRRRS